MLSWSTAYYISEWVIRLVMLVVVTRRRRPGSAMAWLLVISFLPVAGLILYLILGNDRLPRRRARQHRRQLQKISALGKRLEGHPSIVHPQLGPGSKAAAALAKSLGDMPILDGNDVTVIGRTEVFLDRLIEDIDAATNHVHLLFYIYAPDETGKRVADALARAVARGVTCRVLVDGVGSRPMLKKLARAMRDLGIDVREALPVGLFRRRVSRIDLRNHRKIAVIDGRIAYAGSQNIINADYGFRRLVFHDMMVRLTGPVALELQLVFASDWHFETDEILDGDDVFPEPHLTGSTPVQALPSGPNYPTENYQRLVVAVLHAARERVILTTPYFVPDEAFLQALETAVLRGVKVDLIVPRKSDHALVTAASRAYYDDLLTAGVKVHLFTEGILHTKAMSVDDTIALIGSGNFDIRSFKLNFEINMVFHGPGVTAELRRWQLDYIQYSDSLTAEEWSQRPRIRKVLSNIAKLLSPLL